MRLPMNRENSSREALTKVLTDIHIIKYLKQNVPESWEQLDKMIHEERIK